MVGDIVVGLSIILLGWCVPLGLIIGYSNLLLFMVISLVPLSPTDVGLWVDGLHLPFANHLLYITGLLLLFSVKVPVTNFN